jgi:hypothetical protein
MTLKLFREYFSYNPETGIRWAARLRINGKNKYLGIFKNEKKAHEAYINKLKEIGE